MSRLRVDFHFVESVNWDVSSKFGSAVSRSIALKAVKIMTGIDPISMRTPYALDWL